LDLVEKRLDRLYDLTELGRQYVHLRDVEKGYDFISEYQASLVRAKIIENPFATRVIFGIFTMVERIYH